MVSPLLLALLVSAAPDTGRIPAFSAPAPAPLAEHVAVPPRDHPPLVSASVAGMSFSALLRAEEAVRQEVRRGGFPGAALVIGRRAQVVIEQGVGQVSWDPSSDDVDPDHTVYDLASLTKVIATTTAVMLLVEDGKMELDAPVVRYLPEFFGERKTEVTVRQLLSHTSGLPAGADLWAPTPDESLRRALQTPLVRAPGSGVEYSDVGPVVLWAAAERAAGEPLYRLLDRRVFGPLEMRATTFLPGNPCSRCAPTALLAGGELRGRVHDPISVRLGGIAGNAGLFATAHDIGRFAAMLANGGELDGVRVLKAVTIDRFTRRQPGAGTRALGWDTPSGTRGGAAGFMMSANAFGHTGFTGTSVWIDPDRGTWAVLLSNRTYAPKAPNRIQAVRRMVHSWVAASADQGGALAAAPETDGTSAAAISPVEPEVIGDPAPAQESDWMPAPEPTPVAEPLPAAERVEAAPGR